MKNRLLNPWTLGLAGLLLGVVSRLFDLYTQNLGDIFSQMAVWILMGTLIALYSDTPGRAALHILPFCLGMLLTYYATAALTRGVYSVTFIVGWTVFALCSPALAALAWFSREKGVLPVLIRVGIVAVSVLSSLVLFDGFRFHDAILNGLLINFLIFHRIRRAGRPARPAKRLAP